jgi:2-phosphoglycolate phosphatase
MSIIQAVLFDLDGTLLDTAQDLIAALNALNHTQVTHTPVMRAAAGRGSRAFIKAGLNIDEDDERYPLIAEQWLMHYENHLLNSTQLFTGMERVLDYLDQQHIPWGIVTNKAEKFTLPILNGLQLSERTKCVISGDSLTNRKPHPEPLLHACTILQVQPQHCIYVGDSETDIIASKAAGLTSIAALYGYIAEEENPKRWNADGYIQHPEEILQWVTRNKNSKLDGL